MRPNGIQRRQQYAHQKAMESLVAAQKWLQASMQALEIQMGRTPQHLVRSAVSGQFASKKAAKANPRETVKERR